LQSDGGRIVRGATVFVHFGVEISDIHGACSLLERRTNNPVDRGAMAVISVTGERLDGLRDCTGTVI